jgi:hypothetical protein
METMKELLEGWEGYLPVKGTSSVEHEQRLTETVNLLTGGGMPSHQRAYLIREAMTTSDFPYLFGEILNRGMIAAFKNAPAVMDPIFKQGRFNDFRTVHRYQITGGNERLREVAEKGEYLASDRDEVRWTYTPKKYGKQFDISWEAIINDDLGGLKDTPMRMAQAAVAAKSYFQTALYWDASGPLDAYFAGNGGAAAVATTPLTIANLETGVEAMAAYTDPAGNPLTNRPKFLVIGPALEFTARQILTSANKMYLMTGDTDVAATAYPTTNVIAQYGLQLIINPWLPIICTDHGATTWALFSDPNDIPAGEFGTLTGREEPEIFMKASDQARVGGGLASPMDGDFATDNIFYKVRYVFGGCTLSGRAGWASDGA